MCAHLQAEKTGLAEELKKVQARQSESNVYRRSMEEEVRQAGEIVASKSYLLQCRSSSQDAVLTPLWHNAEIFADLPQSSAHANQLHQRLYDTELG